MAGDNKQIDLRPADPFTRIDLKSVKCNQVVPWSLHTFNENFMQIGQFNSIYCLQPCSRSVADKETMKETKKQRNKERNRPKTISRPLPGAG